MIDFDGRRMVDLSLELAEDMPCTWPTHEPFQHKVYNWFEAREDPVAPVVSRAAYHTRWILIDEHCGTHFDAPAHMVPPPDSGLPGAAPAGSITGEQVPLERLCGPAAVVDVSDLVDKADPGMSPIVEPDRILAFERTHGPIEGGTAVLLRSDWDLRYLSGAEGSAYTRDAVVARTAAAWPAPAPETVELLLERGVMCLGTDGVSIGAAHNSKAAHLAGLRHEMAYVEGLADLRKLPPTGAYFLFLPLRVRGGSGAPGRAVGFLPDTVESL